MATETVTSRTAPAEFIEAAGKTYLDDLQKAIGGFKTADLSTIYGPQFTAGLGALTQDAIGKATGLGSFQPFLQTAAGLAPKTGAELQSLVQGFKSPYQQDVIDATLAEFDVQAAKGLPGIAAQAVSRGVLGGGREGVQRAEYQATSDRNRAALLAQLNQQGFSQAQTALNQALTNQLGLARFNGSAAVSSKTIRATVDCSTTIRNWCNTINIWLSWFKNIRTSRSSKHSSNSIRSRSYISRNI